MKYNYKFKLKKKDIWLSSIYYTIFSVNGIFNVLFTLAAWIAGIYLLVSGKISILTDMQKILIVFCMILFPVISPILIWIRISAREKKTPQKEVDLSIGDEGIELIIGDKKGNILWEQVFGVKKRPSMLLFMMDNLHGFIIPNRVIGNEDKIDEIYAYSLEKHKAAREILKKEGRSPKPLSSDQEVSIEKKEGAVQTVKTNNSESPSLKELANLVKDLDK
jgi:hypothetical protein